MSPKARNVAISKRSRKGDEFWCGTPSLLVNSGRRWWNSMCRCGLTIIGNPHIWLMSMSIW